MTGTTVPIAPIPLARSRRRILAAPLILLAAGAVAVGGGVLRGDLAGIGLVAAGLIVAALSIALWLVLVSVRMFVEVAMLRVHWLGGERRYTLVRGPVTRVPLRGPDAARLRTRFGALGLGLGRGTLRRDEPVEVVRLAATSTLILVPTDRGRVAVAPESEQQFLNALAAAARIQQRLDEVAERARSYAPAPLPEPPAMPVVEEAPGEGRAASLLTGIQRAILEERLAEQRAAALAAAEAERQAAQDATRMSEFMASQPDAAADAQAAAAPRVRRTARLPSATLPRVHFEVHWARVRSFVLPALPVVAAAGVWIAAAVQQRLGLPVEQLRPMALALLAVGPAATLAGIAAKVWFPRLVGLVAITSLTTLLLVGRALFG
jgi:hypothetical protein